MIISELYTAHLKERKFQKSILLARSLKEIEIMKDVLELKKGKDQKDRLKQLKKLSESHMIYEMNSIHKFKSMEHLIKLNEAHISYIK